jgi:hypothetical protein
VAGCSRCRLHGGLSRRIFASCRTSLLFRRESRIEVRPARRHRVENHNTPDWLKTILFLTFAGAAALIVAASVFTLIQHEFPLLREMSEFVRETIDRFL